MNAEILCVGTELLLGDIVNTNAAYIARGLAECGVSCYYQSVVGDNPERLQKSLTLAFTRAEVVVTTGGLGPTYDDLTKETVADYFGVGLEMHTPSLERMKGFFSRIDRPMTPNNEKQAMMPVGCTVFENDRGTAPGLALEQDGKTVIMLPGPPGEMTAMFERCVKPYLQERSGKALVSHSIHLFGIGESAVENLLKEKMQSMQNPSVAPYAKMGEVLLRVTAMADSAETAEDLLTPVTKELCALLGDYVYGVDVGTLENALVGALLRTGRTISVAESCTGGLVGKRITDIPGASQVFGFGVCTYSNDMKMKVLGVSEATLNAHGAVSKQTALEMARGVREVSGADIGLSTTGIAGPGGATDEKPVGLVYIAVSTSDGEQCLELKLGRGYGDERESIRRLAASNALNLARVGISESN